MAHPSEGQHFYTRSGEPAYSVKAKAGHDRPVTLRDARTLGLVPGVSTIQRQAAQPGLERYRQNQLLLSALTLPRMPQEKEVDWIERVWADSREHSQQAAATGTDIHAELEGFYREALSPVKYEREVQAVVDLLSAKFAPAKWQAERSFASPLGYGGKVDLCDLDREQPVILDFKTKPFGDGDDLTKLAWPEMAWQLAAYSAGLAPHQQTICGNVFVSTTNPGLVHLHLWSEDELTKGERCFMALLDFYYARTGLVPPMTKQQEAAKAAERG